MAVSPAAAAKKAPDDFFGISPATALDAAELDRMEAADVRFLRFPFFWPILEPEDPDGRSPRESIEFSRFDPLVLEAARRGIRIFPYVYGTPPWVAKAATVPPTESAEGKRGWKRLLRAVRDRYGPGGSLWDENPDVEPRPVKWWQIWNEPNSTAFWNQGKRAPERYAELLRISDLALDRGPGTPRVVAAGLFGSPPHGMYMHRFLRQLYDVKGIEKHFDVVALHPYGPTLGGTRLQMRLGHREVERARDRRTPVWVTEIGWPTEGHPDNPYYTTPEQQARRLEAAFDLMLANRKHWRVRRVVWYTWRDNQVNPECDLCRYAGLFDENLNPKPSWERFVEYTGGTP
jgi:Glycosyl hydrolase catalytic core